MSRRVSGYSQAAIEQRIREQQPHNKKGKLAAKKEEHDALLARRRELLQSFKVGDSVIYAKGKKGTVVRIDMENGNLIVRGYLPSSRRGLKSSEFPVAPDFL